MNNAHTLTPKQYYDARIKELHIISKEGGLKDTINDIKKLYPEQDILKEHIAIVEQALRDGKEVPYKVFDKLPTDFIGHLMKWYPAQLEPYVVYKFGWRSKGSKERRA